MADGLVQLTLMVGLAGDARRLQLPRTTPLAQLREYMAEDAGLPSHRIRLVMGTVAIGETWEDLAMTIAEAGLKDGDEVSCMKSPM